jgi:hypothetical protein
VKKRIQHPDLFFDYLNGTIDEHQKQEIEQHISDCSDCLRLKEVVRVLKDTFRVLIDYRSLGTLHAEHPNVSELAALFYAKAASAQTVKTAAHLSTCRKCIEDIAEYARAERAAAEYKAVNNPTARVPAKAWDLIGEWEDSSFAKPKTLSYPPADQARVSMLTRVLAERREELHSLAEQRLTHSPTDKARADLVPVIIVNETGVICGVELFERSKDADGNEILLHTEKSEHFHRKPFHAVLDFGEEEHLVVSEYVSRHKISVPRSKRSNQQLRRADYFIIEDFGIVSDIDD